MITRASVRRCRVEFHKPLPSVATKRDATTSEGTLEMKPTSSGYSDVNGIKLYHETYGNGEPLVLIHGGLTTIGEIQGWCSRWRRRGR